jgi:hypothetical protein
MPASAPAGGAMRKELAHWPLPAALTPWSCRVAGGAGVSACARETNVEPASPLPANLTKFLLLILFMSGLPSLMFDRVA